MKPHGRAVLQIAQTLQVSKTCKVFFVTIGFAVKSHGRAILPPCDSTAVRFCGNAILRQYGSTAMRFYGDPNPPYFRPMIAFLSPAKTLDFDKDISMGHQTQPLFLSESEKINQKLKTLSRKKLMDLQNISEQLATLNYDRNQNWRADHSEKNAKQAVMAFKGDVYQGMDAENWSGEEMVFANHHLRILSGLYGMLRPSDLMKPYRLEMGTSLKIGHRENLYEFWKDKLKAHFKNEIGEEALLVNLASNEYWKAIETAKVKNPVLKVEFKDYKNGDYKIVSFFAKKARGMMAEFIVKNQIDTPEKLERFSAGGYYFDDKSSTKDTFVFLRDKN